MDGSDTTCSLCYDNVALYVLGPCNHPICHRCSVRMRKMCKETHCPECRASLPEVVVSKKVRLFDSFPSLKSLPGNRELGMRFETKSLHAEIHKLLESRCPLAECKDRPPEYTFSALKDHMRKVHELYYCDICEEHLTLFPSERRHYSRADLARHRRNGDSDGSKRGHPECQFCMTRYLDDDALLVHLRKCHHWCHICERNGRQDYYVDYPAVRQHFDAEHFLCTQGACAKEQLTSVFATELDFQAHKASQHSDTMTRSEARQMRQVDVSTMFSFSSVAESSSADGGRGDAAAGYSRRGVGRRGGGARRHEEPQRRSAKPPGRNCPEDDDLRLGMAMSLSDPSSSTPQEGCRAQRSQAQGKAKGRKLASGTKADTALSAGNPVHNEVHPAGKSNENPIMSSSERVQPTTSFVPAVAASAPSTVTSSAVVDDDFPHLGIAQPNQEPVNGHGYASKLAVVDVKLVAAKPKRSPPGLLRQTEEDFPSLSGGGASTSQPRPAAPPGFAQAVVSQATINVAVDTTAGTPAAAPEWSAKPKVKKKGADNSPGTAQKKRSSKKATTGGGNYTAGPPPGLTKPSTAADVAGGRAPSPEEAKKEAAVDRPAKHQLKAGSIVSQPGGDTWGSNAADKPQPLPVSSSESCTTSNHFKNVPMLDSRSGVETVASSSGEGFENRIKLALLFKEEAYKSFRWASGQFYSGKMAADEYLAILNSLFEANLPAVFQSIVDKLSDQKGSELLRARNNEKVARKNQDLPPTNHVPRRQHATPSAWTSSTDQSSKVSQPSVSNHEFPSLGSGRGQSASASTRRPAPNAVPVDDFPALSSSTSASQPPVVSGLWSRRGR